MDSEYPPKSAVGILVLKGNRERENLLKYLTSILSLENLSDFYPVAFHEVYTTGMFSKVHIEDTRLSSIFTVKTLKALINPMGWTVSEDYSTFAVLETFPQLNALSSTIRKQFAKAVTESKIPIAEAPALYPDDLTHAQLPQWRERRQIPGMALRLKSKLPIDWDSLEPGVTFNVDYTDISLRCFPSPQDVPCLEYALQRANVGYEPVKADIKARRLSLTNCVPLILIHTGAELGSALNAIAAMMQPSRFTILIWREHAMTVEHCQAKKTFTGVTDTAMADLRTVTQVTAAGLQDAITVPREQAKDYNAIGQTFRTDYANRMKDRLLRLTTRPPWLKRSTLTDVKIEQLMTFNLVSEDVQPFPVLYYTTNGFLFVPSAVTQSCFAECLLVNSFVSMLEIYMWPQYIAFLETICFVNIAQHGKSNRVNYARYNHGKFERVPDFAAFQELWNQELRVLHQAALTNYCKAFDIKEGLYTPDDLIDIAASFGLHPKAHTFPKVSNPNYAPQIAYQSFQRGVAHAMLYWRRHTQLHIAMTSFGFPKLADFVSYFPDALSESLSTLYDFIETTSALSWSPSHMQLLFMNCIGSASRTNVCVRLAGGRWSESTPIIQQTLSNENDPMKAKIFCFYVYYATRKELPLSRIGSPIGTFSTAPVEAEAATPWLSSILHFMPQYKSLLPQVTVIAKNSEDAEKLFLSLVKLAPKPEKIAQKLAFEDTAGYSHNRFFSEGSGPAWEVLRKYIADAMQEYPWDEYRPIKMPDLPEEFPSTVMRELELNGPLAIAWAMTEPAIVNDNVTDEDRFALLQDEGKLADMVETLLLSHGFPIPEHELERHAEEFRKARRKKTYIAPPVWVIDPFTHAIPQLDLTGIYIATPDNTVQPSDFNVWMRAAAVYAKLHGTSRFCPPGVLVVGDLKPNDQRYWGTRPGPEHSKRIGRRQLYDMQNTVTIAEMEKCAKEVVPGPDKHVTRVPKNVLGKISEMPNFDRPDTRTPNGESTIEEHKSQDPDEECKVNEVEKSMWQGTDFEAIYKNVPNKWLVKDGDDCTLHRNDAFLVMQEWHLKGIMIHTNFKAYDVLEQVKRAGITLPKRGNAMAKPAHIPNPEVAARVHNATRYNWQVCDHEQFAPADMRKRVLIELNKYLAAFRAKDSKNSAVTVTEIPASKPQVDSTDNLSAGQLLENIVTKTPGMEIDPLSLQLDPKYAKESAKADQWYTPPGSPTHHNEPVAAHTDMNRPLPVLASVVSGRVSQPVIHESQVIATAPQLNSASPNSDPKPETRILNSVPVIGITMQASSAATPVMNATTASTAPHRTGLSVNNVQPAQTIPLASGIPVGLPVDTRPSRPTMNGFIPSSLLSNNDTNPIPGQQPRLSQLPGPQQREAGSYPRHMPLNRPLPVLQAQQILVDNELRPAPIQHQQGDLPPAGLLLPQPNPQLPAQQQPVIQPQGNQAFNFPPGLRIPQPAVPRNIDVNANHWTYLHDRQSPRWHANLFKDVGPAGKAFVANYCGAEIPAWNGNFAHHAGIKNRTHYLKSIAYHQVEAHNLLHQFDLVDIAAYWHEDARMDGYRRGISWLAIVGLEADQYIQKHPVPEAYRAQVVQANVNANYPVQPAFEYFCFNAIYYDGVFEYFTKCLRQQLNARGHLIYYEYPRANHHGTFYDQEGNWTRLPNGNITTNLRGGVEFLHAEAPIPYGATTFVHHNVSITIKTRLDIGSGVNIVYAVARYTEERDNCQLHPNLLTPSKNLFSLLRQLAGVQAPSGSYILPPAVHDIAKTHVHRLKGSSYNKAVTLMAFVRAMYNDGKYNDIPIAAYHALVTTAEAEAERFELEANNLTFKEHVIRGISYIIKQKIGLEGSAFGESVVNSSRVKLIEVAHWLPLPASWKAWTITAFGAKSIMPQTTTENWRYRLVGMLFSALVTCLYIFVILCSLLKFTFSGPITLLGWANWQTTIVDDVLHPCAFLILASILKAIALFIIEVLIYMDQPQNSIFTLVAYWRQSYEDAKWEVRTQKRKREAELAMRAERQEGRVAQRLINNIDFLGAKHVSRFTLLRQALKQRINKTKKAVTKYGDRLKQLPRLPLQRFGTLFAHNSHVVALADTGAVRHVPLAATLAAQTQDLRGELLNLQEYRLKPDFQTTHNDIEHFVEATTWQRELCPIQSEFYTPYESNVPGAIAAAVSPAGQMYAQLCRHLKPDVAPDPQALAQIAPAIQFNVDDAINFAANMDTMSWEEYLEQVEPKKKKIYEQGWAQWQQSGYFSKTYTTMQKANEYSSTGYNALPRRWPTLKTRNLFNPRHEVKAVGGLVAQNLLLFLKAFGTTPFPHDSRVTARRKQIGMFCHGLNTGQVQRKLELLAATFKDPVFVSMDIKCFDAHQSLPVRDLFEVNLLYKVLPVILAKIGFSTLESELITKAVCKLRSVGKVQFDPTIYGLPKYTSHLVPVIEAILVIIASVFSGDPASTTVGNTFRMIELYRAIAAIANILDDHFLTQAGDDNCTMVERHVLDIFLATLEQFFIMPWDNLPPHPVRHGVGMVIKEILVSDTQVNFLSRTFIMSDSRVYGVRFPSRLVNTGTLSTKTRSNNQQIFDNQRKMMSEKKTKCLEPEIFNAVITAQMASQCYNLSPVQKLIAGRAKFPHAINVSKRAERFYSAYTDHANIDDADHNMVLPLYPAGYQFIDTFEEPEAIMLFAQTEHYDLDQPVRHLLSRGYKASPAEGDVNY